MRDWLRRAPISSYSFLVELRHLQVRKSVIYSMKCEGILRVNGQSDEMLSIHRTINQGKRGEVGGKEKKQTKQKQDLNKSYS